MAKITFESARTEAMSFVTTRKTKDDVRKLTMMHRISFSELVNRALTDYMEKYKGDIEKYNNFFGEE